MATAVRKPRLVDAQEMAKKHPGSFEAPTQKELDAIKSKSIVKVCFDNKERMWAILKKKEGKGWIAELNNSPMEVNYELGEMFYLEPRHIYSIY